MATREEKNKAMQKEIESDELREKRKRIVIIFFKILLIVVTLFSIFYYYTKHVSTKGLIVKEKRITTDKIPSSFKGIKIIQFSDLHYGSTIFLEDLDSIVNLINIRKPDIILFSGDLIDKHYNIKSGEVEKIIKKLSNLDASIGKYAVTGDEDGDSFNTIMKECGFTVLDNSNDLIYNNDYNPIEITGLSSIKNRDINKAFTNYKNEYYNLVLMHEADSIDDIDKYNVDIAFAGSSLNGQICLTKDSCFIKKEGSKKYFKEYYKVNNTDLFISSGIGSSNPEFRFMARPSINFFRLALTSK